ncbi:FAD-dependent oxidoreductase [Chloroflexota bacterium]
MEVAIHNCEVLVIGGGFAGAWAAIKAKDFSDTVLLVDKAKVAKSGASTFAAGIQLCPADGDDLNVWLREIVEASGYFADQDWVDIFLRNQIERIKEYDAWGARLERDEKGNIARIVGRGHINTRLFQFHGPELMALLKRQALQKGVKLIERIMILDLLTSDGKHPTKGRVIGGVGLDTMTGEFHIFQAKATILAAGGISPKYGRVVDNCTGDGVAAAFRCGAEVTNMEFCTTGNIVVWERKGFADGINMIQGHGAYFVNALGQRFMEKYDSLLKERSVLYKLCMSFCKEALEGRGPIYVDMRHFPRETFEKFKRVLPRPMKFWAEMGVDISKQTIQCTPHFGVATTSGSGGIRVGLDCRTGIDGLFAAGAITRSPIQGIYALGGIATASCNVMGYIAGENAAKAAVDTAKVEVDMGQVEEVRRLASAPLQTTEGHEPADLFAAILEATVPAPFSMFKSENRIVKVLSKIERIKEDLGRVTARDHHELIRANELRNYILCCELVFRAALERKESRHYHYREDYPYQDDLEWLKLVIMKKEEDRITIQHEPIPISRWPVRPERLVKISHPVQIFLGD